MRNIILTLLAFVVSVGAQSQTDDLMIVGYVDWQGGSGWAVKVYNPTSQSINLGDYAVVRYRDGDPAINATAPLSGSLAPGQHSIIGNSDYCNNCSSGCTSVSGIVGTNGEDAIAIYHIPSSTNIDMVGAWGVQTEITVNGISDAVYQHTLTRKTDNCTRYYDIAGTSDHSWPDNVNENVTTWEITSPQCLNNGSFSFQRPDFTMPPDTTICEGQELVLDYSGLNVDSYSWLGENNETASITIADSGTYTLGVSRNFCSRQRSIEVITEICDSIPPPPPPTPVDSIVFIPNIITPNQDNHNETFLLSGFTEQVSLTVYNRWGVKVYESADYQNDWQGGDLADGLYFYQVREGFAELNGWLQIQR